MDSLQNNIEGEINLKIFIDQGHNPQNPNAGAEGFGLREQDITYKIGVLLYELLSANSNYQAKLSRPFPDTQLGTSNSTSLAARVNAANEWGADYFLSLHCNASTSPSVSGSECYVYRENSYAYWMAERLLIGLNASTGLRNRGIFINKSFYVLRRTKMPAVLVEMGYISNEYDANLMNNRPELFAEGLYNGIISYFA